MSIHEPPQFTPGQVLDAGRRAEAEGRDELAHKFYRHLAEHYAGTPEASAAMHALARLGQAVPGSGVAPVSTGVPDNQFNGYRSHPPAGQPQVYDGQQLSTGFQSNSPPQPDPHLQAPLQAPSLSNPFDAPRPPEPAFGQWQQPYAPQSTADPYSEPSHRPIEPLPVELPPRTKDYRTGRVLARLVTWLGFLVILGGLVLLPVAALNPRVLSAIPMAGTWGAGLGAALIAGGVVQILIGQLVRALLDSANATRDLAAITRAEAEARHGGSEHGQQQKVRRSYRR